MKAILTVNKEWTLQDYDALFQRDIYSFRANGIHLNNATIDLLKMLRNVHEFELFYDLPGVKTRIWTSSKRRENVNEGDKVFIGKNESERFYVTGGAFWEYCKKGDLFYIRRVNRTSVIFEVVEKGCEKVKLKVLQSGIIGNGYHIFNPNEYWENELLSVDDKMQKNNIDILQPNNIAVSFADNANILLEAKAYFGKEKKYFAKIESPQAVSNIDQIIEVSDGIIIGRDDMSAYYSKEQIYDIINVALIKCKEKSKKCIGASNYMQNVYETGKFDENDKRDISLLLNNESYGVYINETNKDIDWKKYLNAFNKMIEAANVQEE